MGYLASAGGVSRKACKIPPSPGHGNREATIKNNPFVCRVPHKSDV